MSLVIEALVEQIISKSVKQHGLFADEKWLRDGIQLVKYMKQSELVMGFKALATGSSLNDREWLQEGHH